MTLVIVESPTKAKTISKFLGKGYTVESSYGHVRDLPRSKLGVDPEHNFEVQYLIPKKASPNVKHLKEIAEKEPEIILATDEDREGEAIAWHLREVLNDPGKSKAKKAKPKIAHEFKRIVFHEITESAIQNALKHPRELNMNLVDAQQARRALDRLVGYKLSPFLWKKVSGGLSAGRVQSVAVRLIVERENEIRAFKPEEYHTITAMLKKDGVVEALEAELINMKGEPLDRLGIKTSVEAEQIVADMKNVGEAAVSQIEKKEVNKNPLPPFITSTMQQDAAKRLGFSSKKTMMLAQRLYEKGHITYMRTDSVNLSEESLTAAKAWLTENRGVKYAVDAPRVFKKKSKLAQEAHEAIRPAKPSLIPQAIADDVAFSAHGGSAFGGEEKDEARLYELIWRRFMASQMPKAVFDATHVEFSVTGTSGTAYILALNGNVVKFDGYLNIWPTKFVEKELPEFKNGEKLTIADVLNTQHFTEPPPRYNEASLIKTMEKFGIGRPSTYAPTISTIQARNYVEKLQGRFHPTEIGEIVNKILSEHFPSIVDIDFTAKMEEGLDGVAEGQIGRASCRERV